MDFIFEYWWIFVLPLVPISIFRYFRRERERTRQMELAAARLDLVFQKKDPGLPFRAFSLLGTWRGRIHNVSKGEVGGCEIVLLDYWYTTGLGEGTRKVNQTINAVRVAGLKFPAFLLEAKPARVKGIKFDSHPQFSEKYRLTGADEAAIRQLFGSYVLEFFQHARGESVECDGKWMIIYRSGHRIHPDKLEGFLGESMRILDVFQHRT